jgi:hypothetical protein
MILAILEAGTPPVMGGVGKSDDQVPEKYL